MLLKAAEDFHISLADSWMIGDGKNDVQAGRNAGCRTALIDAEGTLRFGQDRSVASLLEFAATLEEGWANAGN
jgi:D-glycero-D-manno-heptose 1,7-bisphosphate phosphatase